MSVEGLLISLILIAAGIAGVVFPLFRGATTKTGSNAVSALHSDLTQRYTQVLATIRDLDDDNSTGKILAEEYNVERHRWAQQGVQLLKEIEQLEQEHPVLGKPVNVVEEQRIDDAIETAVARYRDHPVAEV